MSLRCFGRFFGLSLSAVVGGRKPTLWDHPLVRMVLFFRVPRALAVFARPLFPFFSMVLSPAPRRSLTDHVSLPGR